MNFCRYLHTCAFAPLQLLIPLLFIRDRAWRGVFASFTFFVPALLVVGLWTVTNGQTEPRLGNVGPGLAVASTIWVVLMCLASVVCGALGVRSHWWALLWMVPGALAFLFLGFFLLRVFT